MPESVRATAAFDAATVLGQLVRAHFGAPCTVVVNANRQRVLWWRQREGQVELSVHWALLPHAGDVLAWIRKDEGSLARIRSRLPSTEESPPPVREDGDKGHVHDLAPWLDRERGRWPECPDNVYVEWGSWPKVPPRRSLKLGSCLPPRIRIHPVLDHASVPGWFVGFVVHHEVLHVRYPPTRGPSGRRQVHTRSFRSAERRHPDYARAQQLERTHLGEWLARCRSHIRARRPR